MKHVLLQDSCLELLELPTHESQVLTIESARWGILHHSTETL